MPVQAFTRSASQCLPNIAVRPRCANRSAAELRRMREHRAVPAAPMTSEAFRDTLDFMNTLVDRISIYPKVCGAVRKRHAHLALSRAGFFGRRRPGRRDFGRLSAAYAGRHSRLHAYAAEIARELHLFRNPRHGIFLRGVKLHETAKSERVPVARSRRPSIFWY